MNSLSFNTIHFHPIQRNDDQIWITSSELARALGYAREDSVSRIYDRNSDEFTSDMTKIIDNPQTVNLTVRIFSLRGCHLITFFARTPVAKEFRKWVLDVLEKEVLQQQIDTRVKINSEQQAILKEIIDRRCEGSVKKRTELWSRHNQHFRIPRYSELLAIHFQDAVDYLETIQLKSQPEKQKINMNAYEDKDVQYIMWYAPMLARLIFNDIVPALRALDSCKVGSLFSYTQEMIGHVNTLNRRAKEQGVTTLEHVENRAIY
ncbi:BRO family, N-terminal domain [Acinetobacter bohemicus]|uniref:BRO family, N-terminal domain n=1 Tax=Acinetobacter bohemicus TaxID=1435036 RepID=A0A1I6VG22_9GAMM|nr:BRO family protein [Acinetobacter bohemicus]SFT12591.1 BRO family, N-terminal domain [Acinetobacter bohemicus]